MKYFVRESLDSPIKGEYDTLDEAVKNMENFKVFNEEGIVVACKIADTTFPKMPIVDYRKAWDDLKTHYENELHIIKMSEPEGYIGTKMTEMFFHSIVMKIQEIEAKYTKYI